MSEIDKLALFKKSVDKMIGVNKDAYKRYPSRGRQVTEYEIHEVEEAIIDGDPTLLTEISLYFYRTNGIYNRGINYFASLLTNTTLIIPKSVKGKKLNKQKTLNKMANIFEFTDNFDLESSITKMLHAILTRGAYYGLMIEGGGSKAVLHDLPDTYCRTRFKNEYNMNILEFDMRYFDSIYDTELRKEALEMYPKEIQKGYKTFKADSNKQWFIVPDTYGIALFYVDFIPLFVASLPSLMYYEDSQERESRRDEEELNKVLINEMPISTKTDEPVFDLDEAAELHRGLAEMLKENRYIDILTVFGKAKLERAQESHSADYNPLDKFKNMSYDTLGISTNLFNSETATALRFSITKDIALIWDITKVIITWLIGYINFRFADAATRFTMEVLPLSLFNQKELIEHYTKVATYGYPKIYLALALGMKQSNLMGLLEFENEILELGDKLVPLDSTHTKSSKKEDKDAEKNKETTDDSDITDEGGAPPKDVDEKAERTIANDDQK